jgi:hypothetical protein
MEAVYPRRQLLNMIFKEANHSDVSKSVLGSWIRILVFYFSAVLYRLAVIRDTSP